MIFDLAFDKLIGHEGGLSKDPTDPGNWTGGREGLGQLLGTKYGVSAASYPKLDIPNLTLDQAKAIYLRDFWALTGCAAVPDALKYDLFDFAVNSGPGMAVRRLQRVVGAVEDGAIGPKTLLAIGNFHPAEIRLGLFGERLKVMAEAPAWRTQSLGWARRLYRLALEK